MIYHIYKQLGETPLEALGRVRDREDPNGDHSWTYAGRLDPMAEGWMHVLSGDDVHRKEEFMSLDKVYELEVLWSIETDSYDLLGIPQKVSKTRNVEREALNSELSKWETTFEQAYPPFSSKPVEGKPLWQWAREGRLDLPAQAGEIDIPTKRVTVYSIEHHGEHRISCDELLEVVRDRCSRVSGDFRQHEIKQAWKNLLSGYNTGCAFYVSRFAIRCSSGTYMRSLAHELGRSLGCGACAFWIRRPY